MEDSTYTSIDLNNMINDTTLAPPSKSIKCKFRECITKLNQQNAKDQIFCTNHQVRVCNIITNYPYHKDYELYLRLVKAHEKKSGHRYKRIIKYNKSE